MTPPQTAALARIPCTWGELVQGSVDGEDLLITCPVDRFTWARASHGAGLGWRVCPAGRPKVERALAAWSAELTTHIRLRSPLRPGAGCASSTADICAALAAASALHGRSVDAATLFTRCLALEPSDGIMFPGIALVDHRGGRYAESLGTPPPLALAGLDPGGTVDSIEFNARPDLVAANRRKAGAVREAIALSRHAIEQQDAAALAAAATISARAHQTLLTNALWEAAQGWARETGALGINVAHSGVVLGLLYDPHRADLPAVQTWLARRTGLQVHLLRLIGGGVCTWRSGSIGRTVIR